MTPPPPTPPELIVIPPPGKEHTLPMPSQCPPNAPPTAIQAAAFVSWLAPCFVWCAGDPPVEHKPDRGYVRSVAALGAQGGSITVRAWRGPTLPGNRWSLVVVFLRVCVPVGVCLWVSADTCVRAACVGVPW